MHLRTLPLLVSTLVACSARGTHDVPRYPLLTVRPADTAAASEAFTAGESLTALTLPCAPAERADNGLDDDCDGVIDGFVDAPLVLTHAPDARVRFTLRAAAGDGQVVLEGTPLACEEAALRVLPLRPPPGHYLLVAEVMERCSERPPSLSIAARHQRQVYAVALTDDGARALGRVFVPAQASPRGARD